MKSYNGEHSPNLEKARQILAIAVEEWEDAKWYKANHQPHEARESRTRARKIARIAEMMVK